MSENVSSPAVLADVLLADDTDSGGDVASFRLALAESIEARAFLESVLNASGDCIKVLTFDGALVFMNEGGKRVMEVDDFEALRGCPWTGFWDGPDREQAEAALGLARSGRVGRFLGAANTAKGNPRFWEVTTSLIPGEGRRPDFILSISKDITAAHRAEQQRDLLARELSHRLKNSLAIVQAIAGQTFKGVDPTMMAAFNGRLAALGEAQDLLLQSAWQGAEFSAIVAAALSPLAPVDRFTVEGPKVDLSAQRSLALALALHELATNAIKYGALGPEGGLVAVSWEVDRERLRFRWAETGGPAVTPPRKQGFGTRVLTRSLEGDFRGSIRIDYAPSGLVFTLDAPA